MTVTTEKPRTHAGAKLGSAFALLAGGLFGYDTAVISGASVFIARDFSLTTFMAELVVAAHILGSFCAAPVGGLLADRIGRRKALLIAGLAASVGSLLVVFAAHTATLLTGRFVTGFGIGLAALAAPLYASEISPAQRRGLLVSRYPLGLGTGSLTAYLVDYALVGLSGWQWMLGIGVIPSVSLAIGSYFLPETPRWLVSRGRVDEARNTLERLQGHEAADAQLKQLPASQEPAKRQSWRELLAPTLHRPFLLGMALAVFRPVAGFSIISLYGPEIFRAAGFTSTATATGLTVSIGIVVVLTTLTGSLLVDRAGRRPLLIVGYLGMGISMIMLGVVIEARTSWSLVQPWMAVACALLFTAFVGLGPVAVYRVALSEIFSTRIRGRAISVCSMSHYLVSFLIAGSFLTLFHRLGQGATFWLFGVFGLGGSLFFYCLLPETKGRTLEEIEVQWAGDEARNHSR